MGIGGLDQEFGAIFRRAFASRVFPPGLVEKLGIQHVKGESCIPPHMNGQPMELLNQEFYFTVPREPGKRSWLGRSVRC